MGFFKDIGRAFGIVKPKKVDQTVPQYEGPKPSTSIKDTPEGALYAQTLLDRLAGRNVGYSSDVLNANTAPYAISRKENVKNYELPIISQEASARGLGRSTIPVNRAALSTQEASRDIEERVAQLVLANEEQKRAEINAALQAEGALAETETGLKNASSAFNYNDFLRQEKQKGDWTNYNTAQDAASEKNLKGLVALAATIAGGAIAGPAGAAAGALIGSSITNKSSDDLAARIEALKNAGTVKK